MRKKNNLNEAQRTFMIFYPQIIELLRLIASPFEIQIGSFPEDEFPPDEIADEVDYKNIIAESLYKNGFINSNKYKSISNINENFGRFDKEDWTIEAMKTSSNWIFIRELAIEALKEFGVEYAKPNLYWYPIITL